MSGGVEIKKRETAIQLLTYPTNTGHIIFNR